MRPHVVRRFRRNAGFTLVEAIIVIVITGIVASMVSVFIKGAIDAYIASARRAELSDVADTAVRRIARDIHLALPNSVRNPGDGDPQCVEFIPTRIGARYRASKTSTGTGVVLDFSGVSDSFDMLWLNSTLPQSLQIARGDVVVVHNDGSGKSDCSGSVSSGNVSSGTVGGNAYCGYNAIKVGSVGTGVEANTSLITFDATASAPFAIKQLPEESPYSRFQVIPANEHVVAYVWRDTKLYRYSRTLSAARPLPGSCSTMVTDAELATGAAAILAEYVTACSIKYEPPGSGSGSGRFSRNGILQVSLTVTQAGESVKLYQQVHVDNTP